MSPSVNWMSDPEEHDYPAAENFLSLLVAPDEAAALARAMRSVSTEFHKAKDLLRASRLTLLDRRKPQQQLITSF